MCDAGGCTPDLPSMEETADIICDMFGSERLLTVEDAHALTKEVMRRMDG